ncbi:DUF6726 family protein [Geminicoccus roseus]|uniref:DUF6726 family protein n=1 Tax=Geminicoccus roseus TaxID=404900 RepID=UPI0004183D8C
MRSLIGREAVARLRPQAGWLLPAALPVALALALSGCGLTALPFRVTGDVLKVVPVAGDVAAAPFDLVGDAID